MKTLILGGVRSGKSRLAERLALESQKNVVYIATASTADMLSDSEMSSRIANHKQQRPKDWRVVEEPFQLAKIIEKYADNKTCIIIDCLTLWITNLLITSDKNQLDFERDKFVKVLDNVNHEIFIVSNETGLGIMPLGELTRKFGDEAGITNQRVATCCDRVLLTVAGLPLVLKGNPL